MVYFSSLDQHGRDSNPGHLKLVVRMAFPVGNRKSKDLVSLRCVAGTAFKKATGMDSAPDLTPQQIYFGSMRPADRAIMPQVWPPVEKY
ncbi:MAG: hypothetical protein C0509_06915 [Acinetobacter sp.]|nr:hypothetical protein [Acinetobacter sp.]